MKIAHNVSLNVFCKENEDIEKLKEKLISLVPFNLDDEKLHIEEEITTGFEDKKIMILKLNLEKNKHTQKFIFDFIEKFNDKQIELLKEQIDSRLDDKNHFFIRLLKDDLLNDKISLTDSGNCFHVKISLAVFPATKDNAKKLIWNLLNKIPLE